MSYQNRIGACVMGSLLTRARILSRSGPDTVLRELPGSDAAVLQQRMSQIAQRLMLASSTRQLRRLVTDSLLAYEPIRHLILVFLAEQLATGRTSLQHETVEGTRAILGDLDESSNAVILTRQDKGILLDWLQEQTRLAEVLPRVPPENTQAMLGAMIDGYWALVGAELTAITVTLVSTGRLTPANPDIPHWLCLEVRRYLKRWRSALFANDPKLRRRLAESTELLTTEEMERRFGV